MAYEFESMYNHSAYLYPAMASLFRALGAQIANMWQYTLSPVAEYRAGSHYLNAYCTPHKAVSFRIASRVFATTRRYSPFAMDAKTEMIGKNWAVSFSRNLSIWSDDVALLYSNESDWRPIDLPDAPKTVAGCGNCPLVKFGGTGMYNLGFDGDRATLLILPDVRYTAPTWQNRSAKPSSPICELDADTMHDFEIRIAGWTDGVDVVRVEEGTTVPVSIDGPGTRFRVHAGRYELTRHPTK